MMKSFGDYIPLDEIQRFPRISPSFIKEEQRRKNQLKM